jgi:F-type H+-transporting ATPase subunit gamma
MADIHEIKIRIKSIKETRHITNAMKLVSAAKLKKARILLEHTLPYFEKVKETIANILMQNINIDSPFFDVNHGEENKTKGFIVLTGDRGLSGGYNHNIIELTEHIYKENPGALLYVAGQMGREHFIRENYRVDKDFDYPVCNPTVYRAREIADMITELYMKNVLGEVYLVYTVMKSTLNLRPTYTKLLPIDLESLRKELNIEKEKIINESNGYSIFYEPSSEAVLGILIKKYVKGILYGAFVEAFTSEQSARMAAMDNATTNADKMLQSLELMHNRARQTAITREISDIIGGSEILSK